MSQPTFSPVMHQAPVLSQTQEMKQTPQQLLSLKILQLPLLELQHELLQELKENPVIELEDGGDIEHLGDPIASAAEAAEIQDSGGEDESEQALNELIRLGESWHERLPAAAAGSNPEELKRRDYLYNSQVEHESLQDSLLEQLRFVDVDDKTREVLEYIIGNIDDAGYFRGEEGEVAQRFNLSPEQVEEAFAIIHSFEPPGVGARSIKENLLLQLRRRNNYDPLLYELIEHHLELLARNKIPQIAKLMRISPEDVTALREQLRTLNPFPGNAVSHGQPLFVKPDLEVVENEDGEFVLVENNALPNLKISRFYLDLLSDPATPKEARAYLTEKLSRGEMLKYGLKQRRRTLYRIAEVILDTQYDFFRHGVEQLRPLTMKEVADRLGLHETTISRAIANKYLKTPHGIVEFRFFFSGGYQAENGEELSSRSVKEMIREIVANENPEKPLSDSKIAALLQEKGIKVARRTVAKYREALGIPATSLRRQHG